MCAIGENGQSKATDHVGKQGQAFPVDKFIKFTFVFDPFWGTSQQQKWLKKELGG